MFFPFYFDGSFCVFFPPFFYLPFVDNGGVSMKGLWTDIDTQERTGTYRYRQGHTWADRDRNRQKGTDRDKPGLTGTDRDRQGQEGTDRDGQGQTGTRKDKLAVEKQGQIKQGLNRDYQE